MGNLWINQNGSAVKPTQISTYGSSSPTFYVNQSGTPVQVWPHTTDDGSGGDGGSTSGVVDDFESYSSTSDMLNNWTDDGSGSTWLETANPVAPSGSQHIRQEGTAELRSMVGDGLNNYIEQGVTYEGYIYPHDLGSHQYHVLFYIGSDTWSTNTSSWRFEFHMDSGCRIIFHDGSTRDIRGEDDFSNWSSEPHRFEFNITTSEIWVDVYDSSGSLLTYSSTTDIASSELDDPMSIGLRAGNSGSVCDWDDIQAV